MIHKKRMFLGGTCNESIWREELIPKLKINFYDPVVPSWTPECMEEEIRQRIICDYCLYTITPKMTGVYSIAEAVEDSVKRPTKTIFCLLIEHEGIKFTDSQLRSLDQVGKMIARNGGKYFTSLDEVANYVNIIR